MELKDQCASLEQAKRLKELGISERSIANWYTGDQKLGPILFFSLPGDPEENHYQAYTASELGKMLPQTISYRKTQKASIKISRFNAWTIYYNRHGSGMNVAMKESKNLAQAMAEMLIHILEEGFVAPELINPS